MLLYFNLVQIGIDALAQDCEVIGSAALDLLVAQTEMVDQIVLAYTWLVGYFLC